MANVANVVPDPAMDWRRHLQLDSRQKIVDRIMENPAMLMENAIRMEQEAYTAATSQADYLGRLAMEAMPQNPIGGVVVGVGVGVGVGEAAMDWRRHFELDSRQRIVNKIMETPAMLMENAIRMEQEAYTAAISQADYLRRLAMETMPQNP